MEMLRKQKRFINPSFKLSWKLKLMYNNMEIIHDQIHVLSWVVTISQSISLFYEITKWTILKTTFVTTCVSNKISGTDFKRHRQADSGVF